MRESHGHVDEFCLQLVVLRQGNVIGLGDPIQPLVLETTFSRKEREGAVIVADGYIYRCIGMNEALECSPNYPHTRLSTTRSHVRATDFRCKLAALSLISGGPPRGPTSALTPARRVGACEPTQGEP